MSVFCHEIDFAQAEISKFFHFLIATENISVYLLFSSISQPLFQSVE